jgi:branched-chain amino acid transport system ATP-binding protein
LEALESTPAEAPVAEENPFLEVSSLRANYGQRQVLFDVSLNVGVGEVVAMFGHNGAGKTTMLNSIFGLVKPAGGRVRCDGDDLTGAPCARTVRHGMAYIASENFVFGELSVLDNLKLGAHLESARGLVRERLNGVYKLFPILEERGSQAAGTMSGGEQRMLSIGMALMSGPRLLLVDEPSLGLSPALVDQVMEAIGRLAREESLSVLLVEQNVVKTLPVVDRAYFVRSGRIILEESAEDLRKRESYWELF